jgi:hypothetical protein
MRIQSSETGIEIHFSHKAKRILYGLWLGIIVGNLLWPMGLGYYEYKHPPKIEVIEEIYHGYRNEPNGKFFPAH